MVLELHVWGPAFSLPSLDAGCLAAIAYLSLAVPREEWVLVPGWDVEMSPTKQLPALRDGNEIVGGYENIVAHLSSKNQQWNLDSQYQSSQDRADIIAFTAHILTHGPSLLSLSLYVSSENYTTTTRPAYSAILPWPTQYLLPPTHRAAAKEQTAHLGLDSLDLDTIDEAERLRLKNASLIPQGLRNGLGRQQTVTDLVKQQQSTARFRLDALVDAFCAPLQQLLGEKRYFLSEEKNPSSLDALALGYLALALVPDVPLKWLAEGMRERYPALCTYVERGVEEIYGGTVQPEVVSSEKPNTFLPWSPSNPHSFQSIGSTFSTHALAALPFSTRQAILPSSSSPPPAENSYPVIPLVTAAVAVVAAVGSYVFYPTILSSSSSGSDKRKRSLDDMGEAGALFSGLDFGQASQ